MRAIRTTVAVCFLTLATLAVSSEPGERVQAFLAAKTDAEKAAILQGLSDQELAALQADTATAARQLLPAGRLDEAVHAWELFAELAERRHDRPGIVQSVTGIGSVRSHQGRLPEADELFDKAIRMAGDWGDTTGLAWARSEKAYVSMWRGDWAKAQELALLALPALEAGPDKRRAATALTAAANATTELGDYKRALGFYRRSLQLSKEAGDTRGPARSLYGMGVVYLRLGDYARALDSQRQALAASEANDDQMGIAGSLVQMGSIFEDLGDYPQALEHTKKGLRLAEQLNLSGAVMSFSSQLGKTYALMGDRAHAVEAYERALALARQFGSKNNEAQVLNNLGDIAFDDGNVAHAIEQQRASLEIAHGLEAPSLEATILVSLAEALWRAGQATEAATAVESAARLSKETNPGMYWQARWTAARISRARGETGPAHVALDEAIATIEELRRHTAGDEDERGKFFEHVVAPYYDAVDLAEATGEHATALSYAERAKARLLLDCLEHGRPDLDDSLTAEERTTRDALQASLRSLNRRVQAASSSEPDPALLREREKTRQEYAAFTTRLYAAHPELRLQQGELAALAPADIASLVAAPDTALVEFVVLDKRVITFTITHGASALSPDMKVDSRDITRDELRRHVRRLANALAERRLDFTSEARGLYDLLLKPIEERLKGRRQLTIVPDDVLWEIPFQALKPDARGYVIEHHAVSYAPSLAALHEMSRGGAAPRAARTLLGVGDPAGASESASARLQALYRDVRLGALPEAAREVRTLGRIYGADNSTLFTGAAAQETVVKREMPRYDVVHLATHGIFDDASPLYSQIVLAPTKGDADEDGLLEAWEIMNMKLNADLVVLSACQTARGRVGRGEGIIGMSWALLVAGCPTTVVSHWNVESRSTTDLMLAFHRALKRPAAGRERPSKADALRDAELELLHQPAYAHPFYWAAFSVVGAAR